MVVADTVEVSSEESIDISWGELAFTKTSEDGIGLSQSFTLSGPSGVLDFTTDTTGSWHSDPLIPGTYTIVENDVAERYLEQDEKSVEIHSDGVTSYTYENELKRGSILLHKTSWMNPDDTTFTFHISGKNTGTTRDVEVNTKEPTLIEGLLIDTYTITETGLDENVYVLPEPIEITLSNATFDIVQDATVDNLEAMPKLRIVKSAEDNADVAGTKFKVSGSDGWESDFTIDEGQDFLLAQLPHKQHYTIEEIEIPARYTTPDSQGVDALDGGTYEIAFENHLKPGIAGIVGSIPHTGDMRIFKIIGAIALVGAIYVACSMFLVRDRNKNRLKQNAHL